MFRIWFTNVQLIKWPIITRKMMRNEGLWQPGGAGEVQEVNCFWHVEVKVSQGCTRVSGEINVSKN